MTTSRWCLMAALLAASPAVTSAAAAQTATVGDSVSERAARGRVLFQGKGLCFSCHGKDGEGMLGPTTRLAGRPLVHAKPTLAAIAELIKSGVDSAHSTSGQVMPARGGSRLSDADVDAVAQYVLELETRKKPD
jgi:mono/diheme cytochrome c family protein